MKTFNRRTFIKTAAATTALTGLACQKKAPVAKEAIPSGQITSRKIGNLSVSRLIMGGNPFSGISHGEPLVYTNSLFKHYFTPDKVVEILNMGLDEGINTFLGRIDEKTIGFLKKYEQATGNIFPWLAQTAAKPQQGATKAQIMDNIQLAIDNGVAGVYIQGQSADYLVKENKVEDITEYLEFIRNQGCVAGVGAHDFQTIAGCENAGIQPDFYMKTLNPIEYMCPGYEQTLQLMSKVTVPWIAFKVLAAGRVEPKEGFKQAIDAGADFLCVGMFDFQVKSNAELFRSLI